MHPSHRTYRVAVMAPAIEQSLATAEASVAAGKGVAGTGFWPAVARVKTNRELVDRYADRIAAIDASAFEQWALFMVPVGMGTILMLAGTLGGLVLVGATYYLEGLWALVVFGAGLITLLTTTHGLGHLVVGRLLGIRFPFWFVRSLSMPQPGVKVDYSTYLRASPKRRAWMHASGAIVTKLVPFLLLPAVIQAGLPTWAVWALAGLGVVMVITDIALSTKSSDWKKYRREMDLA